MLDENLLNQTHEWPCHYPFKFVVPIEQLVLLRSRLQITQETLRPSRNGKYVGVSFLKEVRSAAEVLAVYRDARDVPGIISL